MYKLIKTGIKTKGYVHTISTNGIDFVISSFATANGSQSFQTLNKDTYKSPTVATSIFKAINDYINEDI